MAAGAAQQRRFHPSHGAALRHADARSESAWESVLRMLHVACDVPVEPEHELYDASGMFVARGDLWIVGTRTLHEYDGAGHRERHQHRRDLRRERGIGHLGWTRRCYTLVEVTEQGSHCFVTPTRHCVDRAGRTGSGHGTSCWQVHFSAGAQPRDCAPGGVCHRGASRHGWPTTPREPDTVAGRTERVDAGSRSRDNAATVDQLPRSGARGGQCSRPSVRGFVPAGPGADRDVQRHGQLRGGSHLLAHQRLQRIPFARTDLQHELVVHLQQHP